MDQNARGYKDILDEQMEAKQKQWDAIRKTTYQDIIDGTSVFTPGKNMAPKAKPATNTDLSEYEAAWNANLEPHNAGNIDEPGSEAYNRFGLGNPNSAAAKRAREGKGDTPLDGVWD